MFRHISRFPFTRPTVRRPAPVVFQSPAGFRARFVRASAADAPAPNPEPDPEDAPFHSYITSHPKFHHFITSRPPNSPPLILSRSALVPQAAHAPFNLTCATLSGPDLIHPRPYVYTDDRAGSVIAFYRLGRRLAGHSGIVHGGVSAAILDECMCRACFPRLPAKIAVTVKLEVEYKSPMEVGRVVVVHAETVRVEGRKAWVRARIEDANAEGEGEGRVYVEAEGLFVQPRWAGEMASIY
ncbi:hypothetical protein VTI74DRAFT_4275 [Chaetomium olivicolor]